MMRASSFRHSPLLLLLAAALVGLAVFFFHDAAPAAAAPPAVAPHTVNNLAVQPGHQKLDATWEARSSGGVPTGYDVHYTAAGSSALGLNAGLGSDVATEWVDASHSGTTTSASITGLTNGTEYRVRVRGTNSDGNGGYLEVKGTPQPTITLTSSDADGAITEGDAAVTLTATLSAAAGSSGVTVSVARAAGSTVAAGDFNFSSASITISSGNTAGTTTLTIQDDQEDEDDETLILRTSAAGHVEAGGISGRLSLTIRDNDTAGVDVSESARTVEVGETTTYDVKLDTKPTASVTIRATSDDTAKATVSPATRTFTTDNWDTAQTFTVSGKAVGTPDIDHTVSSSADPKYPTSMAIDDVDVTVEASTKTYKIERTKTAAEGASATFTVTLGRAPTDSAGQTLNVAYSYPDSTATSADLNSPPTTVTVAQNSDTGTLTMPIAQDALVEGTETVTVTISSSASGWNPATAGANVATITITDDEAANAKIAFHASNAAATTAYTDSEDEDVSGGMLTVPVTVSALPQSNTTFDVEVVSSGTTATENTDYRIGTKSVTFGSSGSKTRNVSIGLTNDALVENDETIKLKIKENPTRQLVSNINVGSTHNFLLASSNVRQGFRVGAGSSGFTLTSIEAKLVVAANAAQAATFRAELWSDASNRPSSKLADLTVPATWSANSTVSFAAPSSVVLSENTTYHLVLYTVGGYDPKVEVTTNNAEDSGGLAGWSVANEGTWQASDQPTSGGASYNRMINIRVNGFAGRPSDLGYHYARNASGSTATLLIEDDDADAAKIAFGTDAAGAVKYTRSHNETTASATVRVTVSHLPAESTAFTVETLTAGADAGTATEYVDASNRGDFRIADKTVTFGSTGAKHRDVPITLYNDSLVENDQTIELRLRALLTTPAAPATLVSNHKQTTGTSFSSNNWVSAQAFTTGSNPAGYTLTAIEAVVEQTWVNNPQRRSVRAELWSRQASTGNPNQKIVDLTVPMDFANTLSFTPSTNTVLEANTTYYFLLYTTGDYNMAIDRVTSPNEDSGGAAGWRITNGRRTKNAQTPSGAAAWTGEGDSMRITVKGSVPLGDLYTRHAESSKGTVTIEDDEARAAQVAFNSNAASTVKFTATPDENVSGGKQTVPITISALPEVESDFTVSVLTSGTATESADYTIAAKTFTFAPEDDSATTDVDESTLTRNLEITITDDAWVENDQTIELEISSGDGFFDKYTRHANASKATVTIHDNEHHDAKIAIGSVATSTTKHTASATEGTDTTLTVPITITHLPESDTTFAVEVQTSGTTARDSEDTNNATGNPKDYDFVSKEVTFTNTGAKSKDLTINIADDNVEEDDEQIQLRIKPADNPNNDLGDYYARDAAGSTSTITLASDDAVSGVTLKINATPSSIALNRFDVFEGSSVTLTATADIPVGPDGWRVTTKRHSSDRFDPMQPDLCNNFWACPNDFTLPGPFTIREGQTEATGSLVIARDNRNEAIAEWLHLYATAERRGVSYDTDPLLELRLHESNNGINLGQTTLNLVPGETATYTVVLRGSAAPTESVTVTPTTSDADKATVSAALSFTGGASSNWQDPQEITVTAVAAGTITITHAATSDDPKYSLSSSALGSLRATVSAAENTYRINQGTTVAEGETAELTVTLGALAPSTGNPAFAIDRTRRHNREFLGGDRFHGDGDAGLADVSSDLSSPTATLTVAEGERRATLTETIADDDLVEGDEHYYVTISTAETGWSAATGSRPGHSPSFRDCFHTDTCARVTITDPDAAEARIAFGNAADATTAYAASVDEGAGTLTVPVTITALPGSSTTFNIQVVSSGATATEGTDYSIATESVTFGPSDGDLTENVTVTITADTDAEGDETFQLRIAAADATVNDLGDHYDRNPNSSRATLTITDDDGAATVSTTAFTVSPGASDTYTVALSGATPTSDVTITPVSGSTDKATVSGALTFTPTNYQQAQTVTVTGVAEGVSNINHLISGGGPAYSSSSTPVDSITVTVSAAVTAELSVSPDSVQEGRSVTVAVELSETVGHLKTIPISLGDSTDTAEVGDYGTLGNVAIRSGSTRATGTIATNVDSDADDETFTVKLGTLPSDLAPGSSSSVTVTITDPDTAIEAISALTVEEGNAELRVKWSAPVGDKIENYQVHYTSADSGTVPDDADESEDPADDATTAWMDSGHTGTGRVVTITGLTNMEDANGIVYRIRARAVNDEQDDTDWSPVATGIPGASKRLASPRPPGPGPAPLSDDATLSGITLTAGGQPVALTETFAADTTTYTASVAHSKDMITVSARTRRAAAVMSITPDDADSETDGHQVSLDVGENRITITVTAEDGTTTRTYTVTVSRGSTTGATLSGITLTVGGAAVALDQSFSADTTTYTGTVAHGVTVITVSADASDRAANIAITPADADAETAGHQVSLDVGENRITITVTAEDGTTRVYRVTVVRAGAPTSGTPGSGTPVTNIVLRDGPAMGEVIVSWDAVPSATHYRIGYVNMEVDYHLAKAGCTEEWIGAFIFVDVNARNIPVNFGRAEYTLRRLSPGARHAFTVLTGGDFVDTGHQGSVSSEFFWPSNPRWKFLPGRSDLPTGVTLPTGECSAAATPTTGPVPPVTNLAVRAGANAGEAILSWDAVPSATHYRIGYVNMEVDYHLAKASCTGEWIGAFIFADVNARDIPVHEGRAEYTVRRLSPGARHAFTVLTSDRFVDTGHQGSVSSEFFWPSNPRWKFLPGRSDLPSGITLPTGECSVPSGER